MKRLILMIFALVLVVMVGGFVYIAASDIPAPAKRVERILSENTLTK